jgi:hypothetical protein
VSYKKIICVDFDGVIHWYRKGWQEGKIYDKPVPGAMEWLVRFARNPEFEVAIYSSRSKDPKLLHEMKDWITLELDRYLSWVDGYDSKPLELFDKLTFPTQKPAAFLTIDDRAICFRGYFPSTEEIKNFKPWNK